MSRDRRLLKRLSRLGDVQLTGSEVAVLDGITASATELNLIDGLTAGTVTASKAVVVDANKDVSTFRNVTATKFIGGLQETVEAASADGAIAVAPKAVFITKAGVAALTIVDPTATTHDGIRILFMATTANAHTVSNAAGSGFFSSGGATKDVATFGGAIGDRFEIVAYQGKWYIVDSLNVTLG